jgi:hypothetical protein
MVVKSRLGYLIGPGIHLRAVKRIQNNAYRTGDMEVGVEEG